MGHPLSVVVKGDAVGTIDALGWFIDVGIACVKYPSLTSADGGTRSPCFAGEY